MERTHSEDVDRIRTHCIAFVARRPIAFDLWSNFDKLLRRYIIMPTKGDFQRARITMTGKISVDLIALSLRISA